jgi:hypothetical protein
MPTDWLSLTTHRLDIYDENWPKRTLEEFEVLFNDNNSESSAPNELHTAYDYIRLWSSTILYTRMGRLQLKCYSQNVISFHHRRFLS